MAGGRRWVPVSTGTTGAGGRTHIVIPATARIHGPTSSFPRRRESMAGGRRWVPVSTGTTGAGGRTHIVIPATARMTTVPNRHSRAGGNPWRGAGDGFPSPRERRAHPQSSFPRRWESTAGGRRRWVPVSTGTTGAGGRTHIVIPAQAGIHGGGPAMGSRLHGNDGRRRAHSTIVIPATAGRGAPKSSFPRRRESMAGGRRWVPVSTGTTGATHNRHSRHGANPRRGPAMGSRLHGNDGRNPQSSFPPRRESTAGAGDGFPSPRERRAQPTIVIPATAGIHGGGPAAMGSRLHGNDGRNPQSSFPRRRESMAGGRRRWVPVSTGTTAGGGPTHNRHSRHGANPRPHIVIPAQAGIHGGGGAGGDGFPSPRERRAHPQSSFPPRRAAAHPHRHSRAGGNPRRGGRRWVPVSTGTTGAPHNRHSRHGGNDGRRRVLASSLIEWRRSGAAR